MMVYSPFQYDGGRNCLFKLLEDETFGGFGSNFLFFLYEIKSQTNTLLLQMVKLKIKSPTIYNVKV
jgi:hypothetical protein